MPTPDTATRLPVLLPALNTGFAAAVGMWFVGFVTHLPAIGAPAPVVGVLMALVQLAAGFALGRAQGGVFRASSGAAAPASMRRAALAGFITSLINLLIVGAIIAAPSKGEPNALQEGWPLMVAGTLLFGPVVCVIGAWLGGLAPRREDRGRSADFAGASPRDFLARFAVVTALAALPVLLSGGIVTSARAGLAVPDWPTTYDAAMFLYPLADMTGGIYYEHAHRLFGSLVGLTTLTFFVLALACDRRPRTLALAGAALLAVVAQGVLGGVRVTSASPTSGGALAATTDNSSSLTLAFVHGITGQLTFALLLAAAAIISPRWSSAQSRGTGVPPAPTQPVPLSSSSPDPALRFFSAAFLGLALVQLALGAAARHFEHVAFLHSHAGFALFVLIAGMLAAFRAIARHRDEPILRRLGHAALHGLVLQLALGIAALVLVLLNRESDPPIEIIITTAHQALGAIVLGSATLLALWSRRLA